MATPVIIQCPVCLAQHSVDKDVPFTRRLKCVQCNRPFSFSDALPVQSGSVQPPPGQIETRPVAGNEGHGRLWLTGLLIASIFIVLGREIARGMEDSEFLFFYIIVFLVTWFGSTLIRWSWLDTVEISVMAMLIFEGIGLTRIFDAWAMGSQPYGFLAVSMVIAGFIFFLRGEHIKSSSWGSCSAGYGGCGGGGCGGGGCGGCGG